MRAPDRYLRNVVPGHPRGDNQGRVKQHILVAEKVLGKPLPPKAVVHHINEDQSDNRTCNLVICEDQAYHALLHWRAYYLDVCGHASWRKCIACGCYDDPSAMRHYEIGQHRHLGCLAKRRAS